MISNVSLVSCSGILKIYQQHEGTIMQANKEYALLTKTKPPTMRSYESIVSEGLPVKSVSNMITTFGISKEQVATVLGISKRRIDQLEQMRVAQKKAGSKAKGLNKDSTERAFMLAHSFLKAVAYFGSEENARKWFHTKNLSLGDKTPFETCITLFGIRRVENTILKLQHGMTA